MAAEETLTAAQQTADEIKAKAEQIIFQLVQLVEEMPTTDIGGVNVVVAFKDVNGNVLKTWQADLVEVV